MSSLSPVVIRKRCHPFSYGHYHSPYRFFHQNSSLISSPTTFFTIPTTGDCSDNDESNTKISIRQQFTAPPGGNMSDNTGRWVWPTAHPLIRYIVEKKLLLSKSSTTTDHGTERMISILELGSGCGLLGMSLIATAAKSCERQQQQLQVIMTDHDIEWLELNSKLNQRVWDSRNHHHLQISSLTWGSTKDIQTLQQQDHLWRNTETKISMDLIVGSDILYDHSSHLSLVMTLQELAIPSTEILLAYPTHRPEDEASFLSLAQDYFDIQTESLQTPPGEAPSSPGSMTCSLATLSLKS